MRRMIPNKEFNEMKAKISNTYEKEFNIITIEISDWENNSFTSFNELYKADDSVIVTVSPAPNTEDMPENIKTIAKAGVSVDAITEDGALHFHCENIPDADIAIQIIFDIKQEV